MKLSINQMELQAALNVVSKGTATRSTLPILSGILFKAYEDTLTLEATDLDLSVRCSVAALVEEEGDVVIPSRLLCDIIKSLPDVAIHIQTSDDSATILCETSSFSLKTLEAQDFPGFPEISTISKITIPFGMFSSMVKRVAKVVSKDESRAILTGILIEAQDGILKMVATDSYRLAITDTEFNGNDEGFHAVISGSFLMDIASLPIKDIDIDIALSENQITVKYEDITFVNRRIEGNYPHYQQLLPNSYTTRASFDTHQLQDAVKRTSLLSNRTSPVKFDVNAASQTTQLSTTTQDIGTASEMLTSDIEGEDVQIAFNFLYVMDGLASIETKTAFLELQGPMKPGILKADKEERFLYLIMPVRLS